MFQGSAVRKVSAGALVGLCAAALVIGSDALFARLFRETGSGPLQAIELKTYDWRLRQTARPASARQDLALVEIDEYSLRNAQPVAGRWPWPRVIHSMILDFLARGPAKVVAYDVWFPDADTSPASDLGGMMWTGAESDQALIDSVRQSGRVILLADATYEGEPGDTPRPLPDQGLPAGAPGIVERQLIFPPFGALADAAAGLGHNLFVLDADGPLRHTVPLVRMGSRVLPSLGLAAAIRAEGIDPASVRIDGNVLRVGDRSLPLAWRSTRSAEGESRYQWGLIDFRGPAFLPGMTSRPYPKYSASDLLKAENQILNGQPPDIDPSVFKDKIVFVGATATGLRDVFETPFAGGVMPGIQVHAAVADDLLSNRFLAAGGRAVRVLTVIGFAVAIGCLAAAMPAWWATATAVGILGLLAWAGTALFARGYWLNLTQPVLGSALALFGGVAYQYFFEGREKRKMKRLFGQYVSRDIYEQLVAHPELARLGGQRRDMTVLFSDIRGFTSVTERGEPEEIVGMLNEYFSRMVDVVFSHGGTLDKFVGDMVMALFGAPLDDPDHADHAVQAALAMSDELSRLNARWQAQGRFSGLDIGIGVNTGPMIAGNIGSEAIMSYTVIGDAVNLGSRLESLNKQYGTRIIISDATRSRLTGRYELRPLGEVVVKGKTQPVAIFEVVGREARV
jgi:adenylate cyclase